MTNITSKPGITAPAIIMLSIILCVMSIFSTVSPGTAGWIIFDFLIKYLSLNVALSIFSCGKWGRVNAIASFQASFLSCSVELPFLMNKTMGLFRVVRRPHLRYFNPHWNRIHNFCNQSHDSCEGKFVRLTDITRFIVDAFRKVGTQDSHALQMARTLVAADLKGHFSHGLNRLGESGYTYRCKHRQCMGTSRRCDIPVSRYL